MTNWIQTFTGTRFPITLDHNELLSAIKLEDICHHLSLTVRFNGATTRAVSVAQHSLAVAAIVPTTPAIRLQALLHDAVEAYVGDIPKPLRKLLGKSWLNYEHAIELAIRKKFNIKATLNPCVKEADEIVLFLEKRLFLLEQLDWGYFPENFDKVLDTSTQEYLAPYSLSPPMAAKVLFEEVQACLY